MMYKQTQSSAGWNHPVTPLQSSTPPGIAGIKHMGVVFCVGLLLFDDDSLRSFLANKEIPTIPTNTND